MSRSAPLYALQQIDSEIRACRGRLDLIKEKMGETEELIAIRRRAMSTNESIRAIRVQQRDQELLLQTIQHKRRESELRLYGGHVHNPKELSDLQAEVKSLARRQETIEESVFDTMVNLEELEATDREIARDLTLIELEWKGGQSDLLSENAALEARVAELMAERDARVAKIPASDLNTYEHLFRRKGGLAVAQLKGDECQGCMASVSASRVKEARSDSLAYCGTCGRILYPAN
jgi:predicted  nucleic acid-binding Zn-ribbon protein